MTTLHVFAVRDRAIDTFGTPFFQPSSGAAIRSFSDAVNNAAADNQLNRHPDDFDLYALGTYDDATGMFNGYAPSLIAIGKQVFIGAKD